MTRARQATGVMPPFGPCPPHALCARLSLGVGGISDNQTQHSAKKLHSSVGSCKTMSTGLEPAAAVLAW